METQENQPEMTQGNPPSNTTAQQIKWMERTDSIQSKIESAIGKAAAIEESVSFILRTQEPPLQKEAVDYEFDRQPNLVDSELTIRLEDIDETMRVFNEKLSSLLARIDI